MHIIINNHPLADDLGIIKEEDFGKCLLAYFWSNYN